jgi:hypothetical protein
MGIRTIALTAKNTNYAFGSLINLGHADPVADANRGRPVVFVLAVEGSERPNGIGLEAKDVKFE